MIVTRKEFAYIRTPKTGTTSIYRYLNDNGVFHDVDLRELDDHIPYAHLVNLFPDFCYVCAVRNPIEWVESFFTYLYRNGQLNFLPVGRKYDVFIQRYIIDKEPFPKGKITQEFYISNDILHVQNMFKFENISTMVTFIGDILGVRLNGELPHINSTKRLDIPNSQKYHPIIEKHLVMDFELYEKAR